ncbi:nuclear transport factor 2 family protein [Gammaproteobacteria bacterium]|nr:nuclear transport factor 2 family protein [Gammaproteobacteria bacterium]
MKKVFTLFAIILSSAFLSTFAQAQGPLPVMVVQDQQAMLESDDPQLEANKKMVYEFWRLVFNTRDMTLAPNYMQEDYIQHNPNVNTGRAPFIAFFGSLPKQEVQDTIPDLAHIMAEGDFVTLAFRREMPRPGSTDTYTTTWFDMFRIEDGKLAEHWDYGTIAP